MLLKTGSYKIFEISNYKQREKNQSACAQADRTKNDQKTCVQQKHNNWAWREREQTNSQNPDSFTLVQEIWESFLQTYS